MHTTLKLLAAAVWYVGGVVLVWKGAEWLAVAGSLRPGAVWPWIAGGVGAAVGLWRGRTMFRRACRRNLDRIRALEKPNPLLFFRPVFFLALAAMFAAAWGMSLLAGTGWWAMNLVGALDLVIGVGLLASSLEFWTYGSLAARARG